MKLKKIKMLLAILATIFVFPITALAANGNIDIKGTSSAVVGNTVSITVTLSSNTEIGSWDMDLKYDKAYLQLLSTTSEGGGVSMVNSSSGTKKKSYTFKFKALKSGTTKVSMSSYSAYAYSDFSELDLSAGSKSVKIMTQAELEATYSKNNNLKSLVVEGFELSPAFNKNTLEYNVVVPEDTKEIKIIAKAADSKASVSQDGVKTVTAGTNTFEIEVRAENGSEKIYKVTVEVKDTNPINVTIKDKQYTVVKIKENLPENNSYMDHTIYINEIEIPAYYNEATKIILVGLKDETGNISLFKYDEKSEKYEVYQEISSSKVTILPLTPEQTVPGYTKGTVTINNLEVDGYYYAKNSSFAIIYGMDVETGEKGLYIYDKDKQTLQRYNDEYANDLQEKIELYSYIIIGFCAVFLIMFIIIIVLAKKKGKKKKKERKANE